MSLALSDPTKLMQMLILFRSIGANYNSNLFYYAVQPGDLVEHNGGNANYTQLFFDSGAAESQIIAGWRLA